MSGRKPMSSIRSASSRTTKRMSPNKREPRPIRSITRPGRADDDSAPAAKMLDLLANRLAAVDAHDVYVAPGGELDALVADLDGQLAGRHEDQRLRTAYSVTAAGGVPGSGCKRRRSCRCPSGPDPSGRCPPGREGSRPLGWAWGQDTRPLRGRAASRPRAPCRRSPRRPAVWMPATAPVWHGATCLFFGLSRCLFPSSTGKPCGQRANRFARASGVILPANQLAVRIPRRWSK